MSQTINPEELQLFKSCLQDYSSVTDALAGTDRQRLIASLALMGVMYADDGTGDLATIVDNPDHERVLRAAFPLGYVDKSTFYIGHPNSVEAIGRLEEWLPLSVVDAACYALSADEADELIAYGFGDGDSGDQEALEAVFNLVNAWFILLFPEGLINKVKVKYSRPDAVRPSKSRFSDVGLDLTLVGLHSQKGTMRLFHTGVHVTPPLGYYTQVVPRSSIVKTGFMLANSVGIIDPAYTGEILIALQKVDPDAAELELPLRLGQLILVKREHFIVEEVDSLTTTDRGAGGFGSTGR